MKLITDKFFDNPSSIEKIWDKPSQELHGIQPMTNFTAQEDFKTMSTKDGQTTTRNGWNYII